MRRAAAGLVLFALAAAQAPAQPADPLVAQRRVAFVLRQATQHYEAGEYQAALDRLDALPEAAAADPATRNLRGAVLTKLGDHDGAAAIFAGILEADPGYFPAAYNRAEVLATRGDHEAALAAFTELAARDPRNELLRFKVVLCEVKLGRAEDAAKSAAKLIPAGATPAWYYAQAVLARAAGDGRTADRHLDAGRAIYGEEACRIFEESLEDQAP